MVRSISLEPTGGIFCIATGNNFSDATSLCGDHRIRHLDSLTQFRAFSCHGRRLFAVEDAREMSKVGRQPDGVRDWVRLKRGLVAMARKGTQGELIFDIDASCKGLDKKIAEKYIALAADGWAKQAVILNVKILEGVTFKSLNASLRFEPCKGCGHEIQGFAEGSVIAIDIKHLSADVAQHEFGHWMGLGHQRNETGSIMSYAMHRKIRRIDADRLRNCYLNASCGWR
jgi:hypothetical protein